MRPSTLILVGAAILLSSGFLSDFWNDVMTIIATVVMMMAVIAVALQQGGNIKRLWRAIRSGGKSKS